MEILNEIFRIAHTLKGMSGTMGYTKMQNLTHNAENVLSEIKELQEDVKQIKMEIKSAGYDVKAINAIIKLRAMNKNDRDYQEEMLNVYRKALGL